MRKINSFIKIEHGQFMKISWYKDNEGNKKSTKEPFTPTPDQLKEISNSKYGEISLN